MSQENVEIVRRFVGTRVDALDDQSLDLAMQIFHPDVEFHEDPTFPEASVYRGHDALRAYAKRFSGEFDQFWWEADEFLDAGDDQVLILLRVRGRGKGSGADFDIQAGWLLTLREESAVRVDAYLDQRKALEAAGLRE
jgi:ketosteroid isomerase-like protein